jgi:poly(A) polymerase
LIQKFIRRVLRLDTRAGPRVIPVTSHGIRRDSISHGARRVCEGLHKEGHAAYVVGGAVRDLLLGVKPKDFDVATDASPDEVHRLFRRSRLIGRRFKIVHVISGSETVEVSTFRAGDASDTDEHGRVLRDNVFGTREEDAARRDFTVNSLYYDPAAETVLDFHDGMHDLRKKSVRVIGDPQARYRQDPVRMLRAVRFAAKLGFHIDPRTFAPIAGMASLLENVPPARLFDEMLKLLMSGHAVPCVGQLRAAGLHHGVLPLLDVILEQPLGEKFVLLALGQTDERVQAGKRVSPAFLFASLLWHEVLAEWNKQQRSGERPLPALHAAMDKVLDIQTEKLAIPRRFTTVMKEIWALQPRLEQRSGKRPFTLLAHEQFRAGFDFLLIRAASGECPPELGDWWERFQHASAEERSGMLLAPTAAERRSRRSGAGRSLSKPALSSAAAPGSPNGVIAYIGIGANLGNPQIQVRDAFAALGRLPAVRVAAVSSLYRSAPVGAADQPDFCNAVARVETALRPRALLDALLDLETRHGRFRSFPNAPRTLDLDLLLYGGEVFDEQGLHVPHPRMHLRRFVLEPLLEIAPDVVIPGRGPASALLTATRDQYVTRVAAA